MEEIYLELDSSGAAPIETVIVLFTMKYCESNLKISFISMAPSSNATFPVDLMGFPYKILKDAEDIPEKATSCQLPTMKLTPMSFVAGLCACLRQIIKLKVTEVPNHYCKRLLGFKDSCLLAPCESSSWTKFCEVDLISTLNNLKNSQVFAPELPESVAKFEMHMSHPARLHNISKYTISKKYSLQATQDILLDHTFAESAFMTLADMIIFVNIHIILHFLSSPSIASVLPLTVKWYNKMTSDGAICRCLATILLAPRAISEVQHFLPEIPKQTLYKSDMKRYKPKNKIYTRQEDVETALNSVDNLGVDLTIGAPFATEIDINWWEIPFQANPDGGSLPLARSKRKYQQLENMCRPVLKLAKSGDVIVDFCAGSGHLGILIAYLRKDCTIVILENKEESLNRAKLRVEKLKLDNVQFYQCNLDYFKGDFHIGTSLHACGVATDLVIQHCLRRNAIFVCCPCCYGSVQNCHHLTYPRSDVFRKGMQLREYLVLGHAADQTHDEANRKTKQGYRCMTVIDSDRKLQAQEHGYHVVLSKLVPKTCTLKNHMLIGVPRGRFADDIFTD